MKFQSDQPQKIICFWSADGWNFAFLGGKKICFLLWNFDSSLSLRKFNRKCICYIVFWFLSRLSTLFRRKETINRCSQNPNNSKICEEWVTFFSKLARWRPATVLKMNFFTDILQEFYLNFMRHCLPFWNFQNIVFTESLWITAFDSIQGYYEIYSY